MNEEKKQIAQFARHASKWLKENNMFPESVRGFIKKYPYYAAYFTAVGMMHATERHPYWHTQSDWSTHILCYGYDESVLGYCDLQLMYGRDVYYRGRYMAVLNYLQSFGMIIEWSYLDGQAEGAYITSRFVQALNDQHKDQLAETPIPNRMAEWETDAFTHAQGIQELIDLLLQTGTPERHIPPVLYEQHKMMMDLYEFLTSKR